MSKRKDKLEPLCTTSEKREVIFTKAELTEIKANIGRRIAKAFNYHSDSEIAALLKISNKSVKSFIEGEDFPSIEILLSIHKLTGVSLDWLFSGEETKQVCYNEHYSASNEPIVLGLA